MNKNFNDFKKIFYNNYTDVVSLAVLGNNVYMANLKLTGDLWHIKNIEHHSIEDFLAADSYDILRNAVLKIGCKDLPVYIGLSAEWFDTFPCDFPAIAVKELEKAVYWEVRGNSAISKTCYYSYDYKIFPEANHVEIYTVEKDFIKKLCQTSIAAQLCPAGIFPQQDNQHGQAGDDMFWFSWHEQKIICRVSIEGQDVPPYVVALVQNILLRNGQLNLLPENEKPPILNWRHIMPLCMGLIMLPCIIFILFSHFTVLEAREELAQQKVAINNMQAVIDEKNLVEEQQADIQHRKDVLLALNPKRMSAHAVLSNLGSVYIDSVWLDAVKTDENNDIIITGTSLSYETLEEYTEALKKYYFPNIYLLSGENEKDAEYIKFNLKIPSNR